MYGVGKRPPYPVTERDCGVTVTLIGSVSVSLYEQPHGVYVTDAEYVFILCFLLWGALS